DAGAHHDELAPQQLPHREVHFLGGQQRVLPLDDVHCGQVDQVPHPPVHHEERERRPHRLAVHHHRRVHAHLVRQLQRRPVPPRPPPHRHAERPLPHPVPRGIPVRPPAPPPLPRRRLRTVPCAHFRSTTLSTSRHIPVDGFRSGSSTFAR